MKNYNLKVLISLCTTFFVFASGANVIETLAMKQNKIFIQSQFGGQKDALLNAERKLKDKYRIYSKNINESKKSLKFLKAEYSSELKKLKEEQSMLIKKISDLDESINYFKDRSNSSYFQNLKLNILKDLNGLSNKAGFFKQLNIVSRFNMDFGDGVELVFFSVMNHCKLYILNNYFVDYYLLNLIDINENNAKVFDTKDIGGKIIYDCLMLAFPNKNDIAFYFSKGLPQSNPGHICLEAVIKRMSFEKSGSGQVILSNVSLDSRSIREMFYVVKKFFHSNELRMKRYDFINRENMNTAFNNINNFIIETAKPLSNIYDMLYDRFSNFDFNVSYEEDAKSVAAKRVLIKAVINDMFPVDWGNRQAAEYKKIYDKLCLAKDSAEKKLNSMNIEEKERELSEKINDAENSLKIVKSSFAEELNMIANTLPNPLNKSSFKNVTYENVSKGKAVLMNKDNVVDSIKSLNENNIITSNGNNIHLKLHFDPKEDLVVAVRFDGRRSFCGKFNTENSAFKLCDDINSLLNTKFDNSILFVSKYKVNRDGGNFYNYVCFIFDCETCKFSNLGQVYDQNQEIWCDANLFMIITDEEGNLITAHPRLLY